MLSELPQTLPRRAPPNTHRAPPRAPPAGRRAAALLGEMVLGEWSETEDSDAVAADFEEPQLYRSRRQQNASRSPGPGETPATGRYRERLWSGAMGRRYNLLRGRSAEKKALQRALRKEIEGRVAAFVEGEATTITTAASVGRAVSGSVGAGAGAVQDAFTAIWRGYTKQQRFVLTCMLLVLGSAVLCYRHDIKSFWFRATSGGLGIDTDSHHGQCAEPEPPSVGMNHTSELYLRFLLFLSLTCCAPCVPRVCCVKSRGACRRAIPA